MPEKVLETVCDELKIATLAITDPIAQNPTAIATLGLATLSLMCGAHEIATIAAAGMMLNANNSDHNVGNSR